MKTPLENFILDFILPVVSGILIGSGIYAWFELQSYCHAGYLLGTGIISTTSMIVRLVSLKRRG